MGGLPAGQQPGQRPVGTQSEPRLNKGAAGARLPAGEHPPPCSSGDVMQSAAKLTTARRGWRSAACSKEGAGKGAVKVLDSPQPPMAPLHGLPCVMAQPSGAPAPLRWGGT